MLELEMGWLLVGFGMAAGGGNLLVQGLTRLGKHFGIREAVIGLTLAAWATSGPELAVAIHASMANAGELALGDTLGSNVLNLGFILGLSLILTPLRSPTTSLFTTHITALLAPLLTAILFMDGVLSRFDSIVLLMTFSVWAMTLIRGIGSERSTQKSHVRPGHPLKDAGVTVVGALLLFFSGRCVVLGAEALQKIYSIDSFMVGAFLVSIGTSMPELATTFMARWKGHHELSLGALLGSNIFNGLFILGLAGSIQSIELERVPSLLALLFGATAVGLTLAKDGSLTRSRGCLLLLNYTLFVLLTALASIKK